MSKKLLLSASALALVAIVGFVVQNGGIVGLRSSSIYNETTGLWDYVDDIGNPNNDSNTEPTGTQSMIDCASQKGALLDAQHALDAAQAEQVKLTADKLKLESRQPQLVSSIADLDKRIKTSNDEIKKLTDALVKNTGFQTTVDFDNDYARSIQLRDKTLPGDIKQLNLELNTLKTELASLNTALASLNSELNTLKSTRSQLIKQKKSTKDIDTQITAKNTQITAKNTDIKNKNTAINTKNKEIADNKTKITAMQSQNTKYVMPARQKIPQLQIDIDRLTTKKVPLDIELNQIRISLQRILDLPAEIFRLTVVRDAAKKEFDTCNEQNPPINGNDGNNDGWDNGEGGQDQGPNKYPWCYKDGNLNCSGGVGMGCCRLVDACKKTPFCRYWSDVPMECFDADILEELRRAREELAGLQKLKEDINKQLEEWKIEPAHAASELDWINQTIDLDIKIIKQIMDRRGELQCPNY